MSERFGALPLGELHAEGVCAYCGHEAEIVEWPVGWNDDGSFDPMAQPADVLRRAVHRGTLAVAHVCWNTVSCERRRYNSRRRI